MAPAHTKYARITMPGKANIHLCSQSLESSQRFKLGLSLQRWQMSNRSGNIPCDATASGTILTGSASDAYMHSGFRRAARKHPWGRQ